MKRNVMVKIRGTQVEYADDEAVEIIVPGVYETEAEDGRSRLEFEEYSDEDEPTYNIVLFGGDTAEVIRTGAIDMHLSFMKNERAFSGFPTPAGNMVVGIKTLELKIVEDESHVDFRVVYELDLNYEYIAECTLSITADFIAAETAAERKL